MFHSVSFSQEPLARGSSTLPSVLFASAISLGPLFSPGLGVVLLWFIGRGVLLWLIHTCAVAPYGNAAATPRSAAMAHKCAARLTGVLAKLTGVLSLTLGGVQLVAWMTS